MSFLSKIFSPITDSLLKTVGGVIDNLHTSSEEKGKLNLELQKAIMAHQVEMEKTLQTELQAKERIIVAEMQQSDNFTKRARPSVVYIFLIIVIGALARPMIFGETPVVLQQMPTEFWQVFGGVMSVWMLGRTAEKFGGKVGSLGKKITGNNSASLFE